MKQAPSCGLLTKSVPYLIRQCHLVWWKKKSSGLFSIPVPLWRHPCLQPISLLTSLLSGLSSLMNSWIHCLSSQTFLFCCCSLPFSPTLYNWLSCSLCDIIASLPGRMTFHRLWAMLNVVERDWESCAYACAADDKRRAVAPFALYRPIEG